MRSRALYTPPVTPWEWVAKEVGSLKPREGAYHFVIHDWGEVGNKVTVGEPAVRSPPYLKEAFFEVLTQIV